MTPEQILADPKAQTAVFNGKFGQYLKQYGNPRDAASVWFTGKPYAQGAGLSDQLGTTGSGYVSKFMAGLPGVRAPDNTDTTATGSLPASPASAPSPTSAVGPAGAPAPTQVAQTGTSDAPASSAVNPYAPPAPAQPGDDGDVPMPPPKPAELGGTGQAEVDAAMNAPTPTAMAQANAPGPQAGPPLSSRPTMPPPLSPNSGAPASPANPSFGGQVPANWLRAGGDAAGWMNYARSQAAAALTYPGGYGKGASEGWMDVAKGLQSSIQKTVELTNEQKNARDPLVVQQQSDLAITRARARADAQTDNALTPTQLPDGSTVLMPKKVALAQAAAGNLPVQSQPGYVTSGQQALLTKLNDGTAAFQERQVAGERLDALSGLLSTYQTGANSQAFNDAAAKARSFGIAIPNSATVNPAAMQEFAKNAYANVLSQMREQGNKQFVSEVQSAVNSNPNPDLQPEANAAMIAQMKGIQNYHDANFQAFSNWYGANKGAPNDAQFQLGWKKANPLGTYVTDARKEIAPLGVTVPPAPQRTVGQLYAIPNKGVFRWMGGGWAPR